LIDRTNRSTQAFEVRGAGRKAKRLGSSVLQHDSKRIGVLAVAVNDNESLPVDEPIEGIGQVSSDLHHPFRVRIRRGPGEVHASAGKLNDHENVERDQSAQAPHLDGEEVGGGDAVPVSLDKCLPRHPTPSLRGRIDAVLLEEVGHGGPGDAVPPD
jgi:hypothetical protein